MKLATIIAAVGLALASVLSAAPAQALNTRSFVSGHGSDAAACTLAAPCRTLAAAFAVTSAGGEIDVLDPGGYGALTITRSISIQGHGFSGISAASGNAITINAGVDDQINLRGLLIDGLDSGGNGIIVTGVGSLDIQDSLIRRFTNDGLLFKPGNSSKLSVSHTIISGTVAGIEISPTSNAAAVNVVLEQVELYDGRSDAVLVTANSSDGGNQPIQVTVSNSVIANNSNGILCNSISGIQKVSCMVRNSTIANNGTGVNAPNTNNFIVLSRTMITGSLIAWTGNVFSYGDNQIDFNLSGNTAPAQIPQR